MDINLTKGEYVLTNLGGIWPLRGRGATSPRDLSSVLAVIRTVSGNTLDTGDKGNGSSLRKDRRFHGATRSRANLRRRRDFARTIRNEDANEEFGYLRDQGSNGER